MHIPKAFAPRLRLVLATLLILYLVGNIARHADTYHWDFSTYYHAASVWSKGGDPYDPKALELDGGSSQFPFLYPPVTLPLFRLFTGIPLSAALQVWLFLRVLLIVPLLLIWWRWFLPMGRDWLFGLFLFLAFGAPLYLDLKAGNVAIVEQLLLWTGLLLFLRERWVGFCLCIVTAAVFKGTPLMFLGLLALPGVGQRIRLLAGSLGLFGLIQGGSYLLNPGLFQRYLSAASAWDERAKDYNPSTLAALKDIWDPLANKGTDPAIVGLCTYGMYAAVVLVVLVISQKAYRRMKETAKYDGTGSDNGRVLVILLATLVCALVFPRLKVYTLIMVLPAAYYVIRAESTRGILVIWMVLLSVWSHTTLPIDGRFLEGLGWYHPLLLLYLIWGVWMWRVLAPNTHQPGAAES